MEEIQSVTSSEWKLVQRRLDDLENLVTELKLKFEVLGQCKCKRSGSHLENQHTDEEETETLIGLNSQSDLTSAVSGDTDVAGQSTTVSEEALTSGQDDNNTADLTSTTTTGSNLGENISANTATNGLSVSSKSTMRLSNEIGIQEIEKYRRAQVKLKRCDQVEVTGTPSTSECRIPNTKSTVTSTDKESYISSKKRPVVVRRTGKGARAEKLSAPSLSRQKPFVCRICAKRFGHKYHLREHIRGHTGDKPFHCNICSKKYSQSSSLKRHTRVHTGDKPFQCGFCSMKFSAGQSLASHVRRNTGERPYTCQFCSQEFYTHGDLARHLRVHTREKPYSCPFCPKEFSQRGHLKIHLNKHPGKTPQPQVQIHQEEVP